MKLSLSEYKSNGKRLKNFVDYIIENNDRKIYEEFNFSYETSKFIDKYINLYFNRKKYISEQIKNCLSGSTVVDADGFIKFRLGEYNCEMRRAIGIIIDKLNIMLEYKNYIQTIKRIISRENCMVKILNIHSEDDKFVIYDGDFRILNSICKKILDDEFNYNFEFNEDFLLSAVITLAPEQVILHNYNQIKNLNVIKTIKEIYDKQIIICDGCFICKK